MSRESVNCIAYKKLNVRKIPFGAVTPKLTPYIQADSMEVRMADERAFASNR